MYWCTLVTHCIVVVIFKLIDLKTFFLIVHDDMALINALANPPTLLHYVYRYKRIYEVEKSEEGKID